MNERLQELLESVRTTGAQVGSAAAGCASCVGKKAEALLSVAKLNIRVMDVKTEINVQMREVGEMIYATHTGTPTESEALLSKLQGIDELRAREAELEAEIVRLQHRDGCPVCGAQTLAGDEFCRECGTKLP